MTRSDYMKRALEALTDGRISEEVYDAMCENADIFCDDDEDEGRLYPEDWNLPSTYAEIEYDDFDNPEAILGARWDDMNYTHYIER